MCAVGDNIKDNQIKHKQIEFNIPPPRKGELPSHSARPIRGKRMLPFGIVVRLVYYILLLHTRCHFYQCTYREEAKSTYKPTEPTRSRGSSVPDRCIRSTRRKKAQR